MIPILHLRQGSGLYGADRALLALSQATRAPFEPLVGAIAQPGVGDPLGEEARRRGLPALRFESERRVDLACAREVARACRAKGVRLLHAHDYKALFVALLAGARARVPVVATFHGDTGGALKTRFYETAARLLGNCTRGAAAVSRSLERTLRRWVRAAPVSFVPNGLASIEPITPAERMQARARFGVRGFCVASIGRLSLEKGHIYVLEAARRVPMTLLIAGDGPERERLQAAAQDLDARLLGFVDDARAVMAAADVIALPSLTEGLPLVALEAMAAGRCLLASAVGEVPALLADGAGVLVQPGSAKALAEALQELRDCPPARAECERRALLRSRDYDVAAMASGYAALYERALSPG